MKLVVIKCGGSVLDELADGFISSLNSLIDNGYFPVIVHGGGPAINAMLELHQIPSKFHNGLRVTCKKTMEIVEMVLSGQTNRQLCGLLSRKGFKVFGLNGSDGECLKAEYIDKNQLGYVGSITSVEKEMIFMVAKEGFIPVITPVAVTADGARLNINADYAAAAVAKALRAERCLFVTNVDGILIEGEILEEVTQEEINEHISAGKIYGGMIPKVESAISALKTGLDKVMIVSGKKAFYQNGKWAGTAIVQKERVI
ncbi:acetylglutamate kinase [Bacillus sp. T33-2]|uniref:acetylglutamate kinase n=1 Tax=Bacillus sp. T33-2 TaxID=2054168 RepID=UPI000C78D045|nr:acetylglutamate kinase [Bacillus sp. T33-2]PLR97630.1 acetylglutamate kinase [Bacillus sp. T33-2]